MSTTQSVRQHHSKLGYCAQTCAWVTAPPLGLVFQLTGLILTAVKQSLEVWCAWQQPAQPAQDQQQLLPSTAPGTPAGEGLWAAPWWAGLSLSLQEQLVPRAPCTDPRCIAALLFAWVFLQQPPAAFLVSLTSDVSDKWHLLWFLCCLGASSQLMVLLQEGHFSLQNNDLCLALGALVKPRTSPEPGHRTVHSKLQKNWVIPFGD